MEAIYKYQIEINSIITITMPKGAKILTVQSQLIPHDLLNQDQVCIWAIVDTDTDKKEIRMFTCYRTGRKHEKIKGTYIGTFQLNNGEFVGHLFEV